MPTKSLPRRNRSRRRFDQRSVRRERRLGERRPKLAPPISGVEIGQLSPIDLGPPRAFETGPILRILLAVLVAAMIVFSIFPLANHFFRPPGQNKDYDIWYKAGRIVMEGKDLYSPRELSGKRVFEFMYPPAAAIFLAPLTVLGKPAFLVLLDLLNSCAWMASLVLSIRLAENMGPRRSTALVVFPALATVAYVYDAYLLGQPNLLLLACLLAAFLCLQQKRDRMAGALVAFAATCKAFPILVLGYLVYRRAWRAAGYTLGCLVLFAFVLPACVRGVGQTVKELGTWSNGMLLHYDAQTIAQRPAASYEWKNASLLAVTHRLLRHIPAEIPEDSPPIYVNLADWNFRSVSLIAILATGVLCVGCVIVAPRHGLRSAQSDAIELAMLLVLIVVLTPISWFYYGVWLMYPLTVAAQFLRAHWQNVPLRNLIIGWLVACLLLLNAIIPSLGWVRAIGTPSFGYLLLLAGLGAMLWHVRRNAARDRPLLCTGCAADDRSALRMLDFLPAAAPAMSARGCTRS